MCTFLILSSLPQLQDSNRDLNSKLDRRDDALFKMREANRYVWKVKSKNFSFYKENIFFCEIRSLTSLAQSRHLDQRERLQRELEEVKEHLARRDEENKVT